MSGRVLVVDDDRDLCRLVEAGLAAKGFEVTWRTSAEEGFVVVERTDLDAVVTDLDLGGTSGLDLCERIVASRPEIPVTVLTAFGSFDAATAAIRAGACDFVTKPLVIDVLADAVGRAVDRVALRGEVKRLGDALRRTPGLGELVTGDPGMAAVLRALERVADADATVLVLGESGTGKELVARALHRRSARCSGPFVAVDCAAIPEGLLESTLFGHVAGAFTGARTARPGLFLQADGGTLFLDEIADLPLALQPKLLRVLQERTGRPLGGEVEVPFDARVVAAAGPGLEAAVRAGRFRADLYYRLDVLRVELPPLRERGNDVLLLAQHFVEAHARRAGKAVVGLSSGAARRLLAHPWPGNVRELENAIVRAVALARHDRITAGDLPPRLGVPAPATGGELLPLAAVERAHVLRVLAATKHNRTRAAEILGLDRKTLYRKLLGWGVRG